MVAQTQRAFLRANLGAGFGVAGTTALAGCTVTSAPGVDPSSGWPQYRFDAARTGYSPDAVEPSDEVAERWTASTEDRAVSAPAVRDGRVYVNSDSIAALDAADGADRWANAVYHRSGSTPAIADGVVVAASKFALFALDAAEGTERWAATFGGRRLDAPAVVDDTIYVVSTDRHVPFEASLHALGLDDGRERWRASIGELTMPPFVPAVADGTVYVGKERLFALDAAAGRVRWTADPGGTFGPPAVADGTVFVGSRQQGNAGAVFAYDAADGRERWRVETGKSGKSLAVADDTVYVASDAVYALDAADGRERWRFDSNRYVLAAPAIAGDRLYLAGLLGTVRALDRDDGTEAWLVETAGVVFSSPAVVDGTVYVGGSDRTVYAFG
ncbi:cell surface protein/ lipoprotein [Halobacteriales archaeon QS_1_67_19]|nr:MAG: cell surface protein/ lipoprotein [Halobacteriales archaeon QS_1_67_19]